MKVLIYAVNYKPELIGVGKYTSEMAEWLVLKGHQVHVITAPPYYPQWKVLKGWSPYRYRVECLNGVHVSRCPIYVPSHPSGIKRIIHLLSFAISSFPKMLSKYFWGPDVIFVVEPPLFCSPAALILSRLSKAKAVLHIQDYEVDAAFELGLLRNKFLKSFVTAGEKYLLNKFDCVSTISLKMVDKLADKNVGKEKQYLFENWVDTKLIFPLNEVSEYYVELGLSPNKKVMLYSGNMGNKQGLEIIVDAAKQLSDNKDVLFVMCGDGSSMSRLKKQASGLSNMIWLPFQPLNKLNQLLGLATVHLLPQSKQAADLVMPSKLTGMLSSGRPVIATAEKTTQLAKVVNKCGVVVLPEDTQAFVEAVIYLSMNVALCENLGMKAREIAERELDVDSVLHRYECKLRELLSK